MKFNYKPATIKDIAKLAKTSHASVSRVLSGSGYPVSDDVKNRVISAAKKLNYTPNLIGRSLKTRINNDIGVMVPNISNPYYSSLVLGIEEILSQNGYNVLLCNSHRDIHKEEAILNNFMMKQVRGIIVSSVSKNFKLLEEIKRKGIEIIAVDQDLNDFQCSKIVFEYQKSGFIAVEHLIKQGHKNIAYISAPIDRISRKYLFDGYKQALKAYNIPFDETLLGISEREEEHASSNYEFINGYSKMKELLSAGCKATAVFACNDMTAVGVMEAVDALGLRIPEDIAVIGCDNMLISSVVKPKLSTVDEPVYEMSRISANILLDKLNGGEKDINMVLQPTLIIREST